jgi:hypothetical protein
MAPAPVAELVWRVPITSVKVDWSERAPAVLFNRLAVLVVDWVVLLTVVVAPAANEAAGAARRKAIAAIVAVALIIGNLRVSSGVTYGASPLELGKVRGVSLQMANVSRSARQVQAAQKVR